MDRQLPDGDSTGFSQKESVTMTKREIQIVAIGYLSTVCCCEVAIHTLDKSWKKMDLKLMMMMLYHWFHRLQNHCYNELPVYFPSDPKKISVIMRFLCTFITFISSFQMLLTPIATNSVHQQIYGPARRLATQQVGCHQTKRINHGGINCSHTLWHSQYHTRDGTTWV